MADSGNAVSDDQDQPPRARAQSWTSRFGRRRMVTTTIAGGAGIIAISEFFSGTEYLLRWGERIIGDPKPTPVPRLRAEITELVLDQGSVPLRNVYESIDQRPGSTMTEESLSWLGALFQWRGELDGYMDRNVELQWELHDASTRSQIPNGFWPMEKVRPFPHYSWLIEADSDTVTDVFWVPYPFAGTFYVKAALFDDRGQVVAWRNSEAFSGDPAAA